MAGANALPWNRRVLNATRPNACSRQSANWMEGLEDRRFMSTSVPGTANGADNLTLAYRDDVGAITVLQHHAGGATSRYAALTHTLNAPTPNADPVLWTDPVDSLPEVATSTSQGLVVYKENAEGVWSWENLSTGFSIGLVENLTAFAGKDQSVSIAAIQKSSGDLLLFSKLPNSTWGLSNLSDQLREQGQSTPAFASSLVSYVTEWDGRNIAGLDSHGQIQAVWWAPGLSKWSASNLSAITGAPAYSGSVAPYLTSWGGINLGGTNADGSLLTTWWVPGGNWQVADLTAMSGGSRLAQGSLSSYVTPWGGLNVVGRSTTSGTMTVYWWAPGMGDWIASDNLVPNAPQPTGAITGIASPAGTINLTGRTSNGGVARYSWSPTKAWSYEDLSASATDAAIGMDLQSVDFFDLTRLDDTATSETFHVQLTQPSRKSFDATSTVQSLGNGKVRWAVSTTDSSIGSLSGVAQGLGLIRRSDGVYIDPNVSFSIDQADPDLAGLQLHGNTFKLAPKNLQGSFSSGTPLSFTLPKGWSGSLSGTVSTTVTRAGTEVISLANGAVIATKLQLDLSVQASGTVDIHDGYGPQSGTEGGTATFMFYAVPGKGIVRFDFSASANWVDEDGPGSETLAVGTATVLHKSFT